MTLSLALSNAVSGIRAMTAHTEVISNNVSNALTDGYGKRDVSLAAASVGGQGAGVRVAGIQRAVAPAVAEAYRSSIAGEGNAGVKADALARMAKVIGEPGAPGALATAANTLETALAAAADTPESAPLLTDAVASAGDYASAINRIATEAMALRTEADASIAMQVKTINNGLTSIQSLNAQIKTRAVSGGDTSALEDQRDRVLKEISSMIPVKVVNRDNGEIAIFAKNGAQLLDGKVFELGFDRTAHVTPEQTIGNGLLSGITVNNYPLAIGDGTGGGLIDGGSLSAAFELRDRIIPGFTATLDDLAADLITRTQGLGADPTISASDAGLFTDDGNAYNPADLLNISGRISINAAVDPAQGGKLYRLRDGMAATAPGEVGNSSVLRGLQDAMEGLQSAPVTSTLTGQRNSAGFAAEFSSQLLTESATADAGATMRRAQMDELSDALQARTGVDSDQEMTRLLAVEQAFAANARVIQTVDELLDILTRL